MTDLDRIMVNQIVIMRAIAGLEVRAEARTELHRAITETIERNSSTALGALKAMEPSS